MFISEAEFRPEDSGLLEVSGYDLIFPMVQQIRIAAYVSSSQTYATLEMKNATILGVQLKGIKVFGYYRTHKKVHQSLQRDLELVLDELTCHCNERVIIGGDFNIDNNKIHDQDYHHRGLAVTLQSWIADNGLTQMIEGTTWRRVIKNKDGIHQMKSSALDHIYTNDSSVGDFGLLESHGSDHEMIACSLKNSTRLAVKTEKKKMRDWRSFVNDNISKFCSETPLIVPQDVNEGSEVINGYLNTVIDNLAPWRVVRTRRSDDVVNVKIAACIKKRNRLLKKHRQCPEDQCVLVKLKLADKEVRLFIKQEKRRQRSQLAESGDPKLFWKAVRQAENKPSKNDIVLQKNGRDLTDDEMAEEFAGFFDSKVMRLAPDARPYKSETLESEGERIIVKEDVMESIKRLSPRLCAGHDGIPSKAVKAIAPFIIDQLLDFFNEICVKGIPRAWKLAMVRPLHKNGNKKDISNYRPISNLCSLAKLYERCILRKLDQIGDDTVGENQHGFRKSRSTTTAALSIQSIIADSMDRRKFVIMYSIDMSAAFDLLRHDLMDSIMAHYGSPLRRCVMDYLDGRRMFVSVNGKNSSEKMLTTGCIQGSILGPRLFSMYGKELEEYLLHRDARVITYADDSYVILESDSIEDLIQKTETCLKEHDDFLRSIGMRTNVGKTEAVVFNKDHMELTLHMGDQTIVTGKTIKVLGITFNHNLHWTTHVEKTVKKAASIINRVRFIRRSLTEEQTLKVMTSYLYSTMYYGSPVWLGATSRSDDWKLMNRAHYQALRVILRDYRREQPRKELDFRCKRATPRQWSYYSVANITASILRDGEPSLLFDLIRGNSATSGRQPSRPTFFDTSRKKIGRQSIQNRIGDVFKRVKSDWLEKGKSKDALRIELKRAFFPYFQSQCK